MSVTRGYAIHGMYLRVEAGCASLLGDLDALLAPFVASPPPQENDVFVLRISHGNPGDCPPAAPGLRKTWQGVLPNGLQAVFYTGRDARRIELPGQAVMQTDLPGRRADITVKPTGQWTIAAACLVPLLRDFLALTGQYVVHAACLSVNVNGDHRGVIISAPSGRGKTTTALSLSRSHMRLMGDDVSFIGCDDSRSHPRVTAWALPRPCKVHHKTLAMLPWLQTLPHRPALTDDEVLIELADLSDADTHQQVPPAAALFLGSGNSREHRVDPLDKLTALTRLTRENVRPGDPRKPGTAAEAFAAMAALVRQCDTYLLSVGPRLEGLGDLIRSLPGLCGPVRQCSPAASHPG